MSSLTTVKAITTNIKTVASKQGAKFYDKSYDDLSAVPASRTPYGQIFYVGNEFEYIHGQRMGYAEARFLLRIVISERNSKNMTERLQEWVHNLRAALTVNALNIGDLVSSLEVSRVVVDEVEVDNLAEYSVLGYRISVRYRET